jgi:hypothetical protein
MCGNIGSVPLVAFAAKLTKIGVDAIRPNFYNPSSEVGRLAQKRLALVPDQLDRWFFL